ncbi:MAG: electron transport complex subunit RsxC [Gammaproteobacteria bacterium]|nr:electron transport complex subunit RsxC [Gammaproteobacteria bacterium]
MSGPADPIRLPPEPPPKPRLWRFSGGVSPPYNKTMSSVHETTVARLPARLILPLHQHIGEAADPLVKVGDQVLKGQQIARANGYVSAPVHAPTSGRITSIAEYPIPHPSGLSALCIVVDSDGRDQWRERAPLGDQFAALEPSALRNVIREAGIVGLGGAGFPTYIKLNPGHDKVIDTLVVNGVECEPYITCDDRLMRERPSDIIQGLIIARHALQARQCLIAIEENKPEAIEAMRRAIEGLENFAVVPVPTLYPQGDAKRLIKTLTGKEVPSNGLSMQIGVVVVNVGTAAAIYRAIYHDEPLISRYTTITGTAVAAPRNLEVLIGTPIRELLEQCAADSSDLGELIMGGPMMGFALQSIDLPVIKTTNCLLALARSKQPPAPTVMPCIRCGACMDACPVNLMPQQMYWHAKAKDFEKTQEYNLFDCIECGCCSYVCPSHLPLVQYYRYAKGEIWTAEREREKADLARTRHESRQARLEREKAEKEARRKAKQAAMPQDMGQQGREAKQAEIQAAMDRARQRRDEAIARVQHQREPTPPASAAAPDGSRPDDDHQT